MCCVCCVLCVCADGSVLGFCPRRPVQSTRSSLSRANTNTNAPAPHGAAAAAALLGALLDRVSVGCLGCVGEFFCWSAFGGRTHCGALIRPFRCVPARAPLGVCATRVMRRGSSTRCFTPTKTRQCAWLGPRVPHFVPEDETKVCDVSSPEWRSGRPSRDFWRWIPSRMTLVACASTFSMLLRGRGRCRSVFVRGIDVAVGGRESGARLRSKYWRQGDQGHWHR